MSTLQVQIPAATLVKKNKARGHMIRVRIAAVSALAFLVTLAVYGANYYLLPMEERPFSDKHDLLKPSGSIGLKLGFFGTFLFCIIFLYAFRKIIPWLGRIGTARQWMDFHVIAGASAPVVIAFHASFKFQGIAGIAFWIMLAVALSGIIGRYLYSQIPRSLNAAELSLGELQANEQELTNALLDQSIYSGDQLKGVLNVPSPEHIRSIGPLLALGEMLLLDLRLPFQIAALRRASYKFGLDPLSMGGFLRSANADVEHVVHLVRQKASLSRRILFLNHTQRVFHLWHVVHRPFSYAFAVLAVMHIFVVFGLGFMTAGMQ